MSILPSYYIERLGLSDIAVLSRDWHEESGGLEVEHLYEEIVCHKDGKPHRMKIHQTLHPFRGYTHKVVEDESISEKQYLELRKKCREVIDDSDEYRKNLTKRTKIKNALEKLRPRCPECNSIMVQRSGPYGIFWGCPRFPKCRGNKRMSARQKEKIDRLEAALSKYRNL